MNDLTLEERMARLEWQNRWLKVGIMAVAAVVAGFICIAATEPVAKVVRAQKFEVVDERGTGRVALGQAFGPGPHDLSGVWLKDEWGRTRAGFSIGADGRPTLSLLDEDGKKRAVLGAADLETVRTGETSRTAESSLVLFGKDGNVLWKAP